MPCMAADFRDSWTVPYGNSALGATIVIPGNGQGPTQPYIVTFSATDPSGRKAITSLIIPPPQIPVPAPAPGASIPVIAPAADGKNPAAAPALN